MQPYARWQNAGMAASAETLADWPNVVDSETAPDWREVGPGKRTRPFGQGLVRHVKYEPRAAVFEINSLRIRRALPPRAAFFVARKAPGVECVSFTYAIVRSQIDMNFIARLDAASEERQRVLPWGRPRSATPAFLRGWLRVTGPAVRTASVRRRCKRLGASFADFVKTGAGH